MQHDRRSEQRWQIDRHVPIVAILGIFIQVLAFVWYARGIDALVSQHQVELNKQDKRIETLETARLQSVINESRLVAIENEMRMMRVAIEHLTQSKGK